MIITVLPTLLLSFTLSTGTSAKADTLDVEGPAAVLFRPDTTRKTKPLLDLERAAKLAKRKYAGVIKVYLTSAPYVRVHHGDKTEVVVSHTPAASDDNGFGLLAVKTQNLYFDTRGAVTTKDWMHVIYMGFGPAR